MILLCLLNVVINAKSMAKVDIHMQLFVFYPYIFHGLLEGKSSRFSLSSVELFSIGPTLKQRVEMPLHSEKHVSKKTTLSC